MLPTPVWSLGASLLLASLPPVVAWYYWNELFPAADPARRRFFTWALKGLLVPLLLWFVINAGWFPGMPVLLRDIALLRASGSPWLFELLQRSGPALLLLAYAWGAVSLGWMLAEAWQMTSDPRDFRNQFAAVSLFLLPLAAGVTWIGGWPWTMPAACLWLLPALQLSLPMAHPRPPIPLYSSALARMKLGKYREAEQEVLHQLERRSDDFEGWMILAELYATRFNDLPEADLTIRELCLQPNLTPVQISLALHRLADWHLRLGQDPDSARETLEELARRLPDTHFARAAAQRIARLPLDRQDLIDDARPRPVRLPALGDALDQPASQPVDARQARRDAERCVQRLTRDPNNHEVREEFARLLAESLGQVVPALEQLDLLLDLPDTPETKRAGWLATQAAWQLRLRNDPQAARSLLQRIVREFPRSPQALAARRRLELMEFEAATSPSPRPQT